MTPRCSICARKATELAAIDTALRGGLPLRAVAVTHGTSTSTLHRHRDHVASAAPRPPAAPLGTPASPSVAPLATKAPTGRAETLAEQLEADVRQHLLVLREDTTLGHIERSRIQTTAMATLGQIARLRGEHLSEARVMRHPAFQRVADTMVRVLSKWPDAMAALGSELRRLDDEGR